MRSNRGIFWYSLGLTLLLLLPMVLTVAFFTDQYQKQQLLRQASAADSTLHIEPGAQGVYTLLLVVQQEEPPLCWPVRTARSRRSHSAHCRVRCASAHPRAQQRWRSVRCLPGPGGPHSCSSARWLRGRPPPRCCTISRPRPPPGRTARAAQPRHASTRHRCWMPPHARAWATARIPSPCVPPRRRRS